MARNVYEIFEQITGPKYPTDLSIEAALMHYKNDPVIEGLLTMNFSPKFMGFDLPAGKFSYIVETSQPYGYGQVQLYSEFKRLYMFFNGFSVLTQEKKIIKFIQLLESLHWRESELLIAVKDKKLSELFPDINEVLIRSVFPDILPPLSELDGIMAAGIGGRNTDINNPNYKLYTKEELVHLSGYRKIVFKFPEQAIAAGLDYMLPGYIAPPVEPEYFDPNLYLEFTVEKTVFGTTTSVVYHELIEELKSEKIEELSKHGAKLTFTNLEQAEALQLAHFDVRRKPVPVKPVKKVSTTPKKRGRPAKVSQGA